MKHQLGTMIVATGIAVASCGGDDERSRPGPDTGGGGSVGSGGDGGSSGSAVDAGPGGTGSGDSGTAGGAGGVGASGGAGGSGGVLTDAGIDAPTGPRELVVQKVAGSGIGADSRFGSGVAVRGDRAVVGAPGSEASFASDHTSFVRS